MSQRNNKWKLLAKLNKNLTLIQTLIGKIWQVFKSDNLYKISLITKKCHRETVNENC